MAHHQHFTKATSIRPHNRFSHSMGAPLVRIVGTIKKLFPSADKHHGANHQHLILSDITVEHTDGMPEGMTVDPEVFVAIRFGDGEGLEQEVPFVEGEKARMQGEYIDKAHAYPTGDNDHLAVLHFTHHPIGFVEFPIRDVNSHGPIFS